MADICSCKTGILNFGQPNCVDSFVRDAQLVFVNYLDDTGAVNSIKSTDTLDQTFFDLKFNNPDLDKRWFLTPVINNVVGERAENVTQEVDGIGFTVRQGNRMYDGTFYGNVAATPFIDALESTACQFMGFFIIDVAGNIIGMNNSISGDLDPIKVQRSTTQVLYKFPNSTELQNINLKFMYEENERDADLSFIGKDNISVDMLSQKAMTTVTLGTATSISTTGLTTAATFIYGEQFDKLDYEGAVFGDFIIFNETTSLAVAVLTAPESPDGTYALTFVAQTSSDVLSVTYLKATGAGFETIVILTVTVP